MGIFTRLRDIRTSEGKAMLERGEGRERLIRPMTLEREGALARIKIDYAGALAEAAGIERELTAITSQY